MYRIVTNTFIDFRRKASRSHFVSLDTVVEMQTCAPMWGDGVNALTLQGKVEADERARVVNATIRVLPRNLSEIISMFYKEELSYEEIASKLEIPVGTVKSRLNRAKIALKKRLPTFIRELA